MHRETMVMGNNSPVRHSPLQYEFIKLSKEKVLSPRGSRRRKLREKGRALKNKNHNKNVGLDQHAATGSSVLPEPRVSHQKLQSSRKTITPEELVKHMSNVPSYLQRMERRENIQEKALNFGVLDWGLLEKWTYNQKRLASGRGGDSPTTSNESSSSATFGSSTSSQQSTRSFHSRRKRSPSSTVSGDPSVLGGRTQSVEEKSCSNVPQLSDFRIKDGGIGTDQLWHKHEKCETKGSDLRDISCQMPQSQCTGTSTFTYHDTSTSANDVSESQGATRSRNAAKVQRILNVTRDYPQNQHIVSGQNNAGMSYNLQKSVHGRRMNDGTATERTGDGLSGNKEANTAPKCKSGTQTTVTGDAFEQFLVNKDDRSNLDELKATVARGRKSKSYQLHTGLNSMYGSSALKEVSSVQQLELATCPSNSDEDKAATTNRGRLSSLRRMLDPLLKSKNRIRFLGPMTASSINHSRGQEDPDKPSNLLEESVPLPRPSMSSDTSIDSSSQLSNKNGGSCQDESHAASTRQAFLQLAWKNGLPLFMLSANDSDVLAATKGKKSQFDKDNLECMYTIFSVHEAKKKTGGWLTSGNKSKMHGLASNVVGQMKVSCSNLASGDSKSHTVMRQFLLLGSELLPTSHESVNSPFKCELAAIVAEVPQERPESYNIDVLQSTSRRDSSATNSAENTCSLYQEKSLKTERNDDDLSQSCTIVIIPSGVHSLPTIGEPSSLIERWNSGGRCDCGGWDEGCMLTILSDSFQESSSRPSVQACPTTDSTHLVELFVQGGARDSRHSFSMVSFKEGLYKVDFGPSISLLQTLAICIAILHSRKTTSHAEWKSLHEHIFSEQLKRDPTRNRGEAPTSYVPNHPPLSPVRRA